MDATAYDLTRPLGLEDGPRAEAGPRLHRLERVLAGAILAALAGLAAYLAVVDDPLGGEPHVVVPIEIAPAPRPAEAPMAAGGEPARRSAAEVEEASGVSIHRSAGASVPGAVIIRVPEPEGIRLAPAPDPRLVERTRFGLLPKIGADGARPAQVYARPAGALPGGARPVARIALVVTGLGISQSATANALAKLPPTVTLALAPYGAELDRLAARARDKGHELMLQVPMEPFDYPDNDPGPHTLTTRAKTPENLEKLHWAMGRFTGYTGIVNFMGAKLTANDAALSPILSEIGARGLLFLDDGSSSRSVAATVASRARTPAARADAVLDGVPQAEAIDRELARLEEAARKRGVAVGVASALPVSVDRIVRWAQTLEGRGILLVPVSSAVEAP